MFIPWEYIFADAAVSGTIATRRGYLMIKRLIANGNSSLQLMFIDELGRANRNAIEALYLGKLIEWHGKQMIGVSDGFDSNTSHSKILLSIYAMLQEWFGDQLRSKVNREMDDAFRQGKNIHPPSIRIPVSSCQGSEWQSALRQ